MGNIYMYVCIKVSAWLAMILPNCMEDRYET